jgi:predicted Holliday junction resolvase-like endonuclease
MGNSALLFLVFIIALIVVAILAAVIGYFWASSAAKADLLKQLKDQSDVTFKRSQEQLQIWKEQELNSIRQQVHDAAKGQVIQEMQGQMQKWQKNELNQIRQQMLEGVRGEAIKEAQEQLVKWRTDELENAKSQIWGVLSKEATVSLEQWKVEAEKDIRKDAIDKSSSVTMGKMTEHIVPYLPGFGFNPSDARFIGSPIDLIVFDGLGNDEVKKIVFVEIKTGISTLSTRERLVRDAILEKRVEWIEMKVNLESPDIVQKGKSKRKIANEDAGWMLKLLKNKDE